MQDISKKIQDAIKHYDEKDVLVAWDIDLTLIVPEKPEAQFPNVEKHSDIFNALTKNTTQMHIELAYNLIGARCNQNHEKIISEEMVVKIIKELQEKKIKNIALTAAMPGQFGPIRHIESWRYQTLKKFDIDFHKSFSIDDIIFEKLPSYYNRYPTFFKGLLYSNGEHSLTDKGSVLVHFLDEIKYTPKLVILIDDREKNLQDVAIALQKKTPQIEFVPLLYERGRKFLSQEATAEEFKKYWHDIMEEAKRMLPIKDQ
jgi:hypothetical protein